MPSHPTIKDVARKAGVSITTVSFVMNNRADMVISEAVKKRVLKAAREMDYHPSALAAGLAGKRTRNLGMVFYQEDHIISNQFYSFVIEGVVRETMERGFNLYFSYLQSAYGGYQSLPKIIREKNVDGVLLIGRSEKRMVGDIRERKIPVVAVDNFPVLKDVDTIQVDNRRGGLVATEHLILLGHKQIGLLTTGPGRPSIEGREEGWKAAHSRHGLSTANNLFRSESLTFYGGYETTKEILRKSRKVTALFCVNDEMAAGALRAAREMGRDVPKDLSVVGFDGITMTHYTDPPLTTVSVAKEHMGKLAVFRLLELVEKKDSAVQRLEAPVELLVRNSTAKPS